MKVFYDWEFLDDGRVIDPISIGMVAEDGRELYAVFAEIEDAPLYERIGRHSWLMANVVPHLPLRPGTDAKQPQAQYPGRFHLDPNSNTVMPRRMIRNAVREFLQASTPVELWGYYAAYDHVALAQLFGPMIRRPDAMPMYTHDLMQMIGQQGKVDLPPTSTDAHNALVDARWTRDAYAAAERARAAADYDPQEER